MSAHAKAPLLDFLVTLQGELAGQGRTVDGFDFKGTMKIASRVRGALIEISFDAADGDSAFHNEATWISIDLLTNAPALWTVSTNTPGVLKHALVKDEEAEGFSRRLLFRLGKVEDKHTFRQEIGLDVSLTGDITYHYSWGVPHEEFKPRVQATLHPKRHQ